MAGFRTGWRRMVAAAALGGLCALPAVGAGPAAASPAAPSPAAGPAAAPGMGELRVTTSPAVASVISVDGTPRDVWGLTWLDIAAGSHEVCFSDVTGYVTPACEDVVVPEGGTGSVEGVFAPLTPLQVSTAPALPSTITVRDVTSGGPAVPRDDWGLFSWVLPGHEIEVCFGPVAGYAPPPCESVPANGVVAGQLVALTGTFTADPEAPGPSGTGSLRVTTSPAVPSTISVDGLVRDDWGGDWLQVTPGSHEVCFSDVIGYVAPACQTISVTEGETTPVEGVFEPLGWLKVTTNPPAELSIVVDAVARNDWGAWFPIEPGSPEVCFVPDAGDATCRTVQVVAGETVTVDNAPTGVVDIDAGGAHSCAVRASGSVACWGSGNYGSLGNGSTAGSNTPVEVTGITTATQVSAASSANTCSRLADGSARCWGSNYAGQLGDGTTTDRLTPVAVSGITTATKITTGYGHSCALLTDATVRCWGSNNQGQLGNGTTVSSPTPVTVTGITTATDITADSQHTCARLSDGTLRCWGDNADGQLGNGATVDSPLPVTVSGITNATHVGAGRHHACARLADGTVRCWGDNSEGQLGNGTTTDSSTPVAVTGITAASGIEPGLYHTCAPMTDGTARCWGYNTTGQVGSGSTSAEVLPLTVPGLVSVSSMSAGDGHTCAIEAGQARCWGWNLYGQLGDGTFTTRSTPGPVVGL